MATLKGTPIHRAEVSDDAPQGWTSVLLEVIGDLHCGQSPATRFVNTKGSGTPYVTGPDQWDGDTLKVHKWTTDPRRVVPDGCVFITVKGAGVGTIFPGVAAAIGRDVYAFQPSRFVEPKFITRALEYTVADIKRQAAGDIPGLSKDHILKHEIGLPPAIEQHRIILKIDELFADVNASRDSLAKIPKILKAFRRSVLAAACAGRLTEDWREFHRPLGAQSLLDRVQDERRRRWETMCKASGRSRKYPIPTALDDSSELPDIPTGWHWKSADSTCSQITDGEHIQPRYQTIGKPMLTATHVRDGHVVFSGAGLISEIDFRRCLRRCAPKKDDILIVSVGATTGRAAIVDQCVPFAIVRSVLLLRPLINPRYFLRWTQSPWCFTWMQSASGASAQPHLYISDTKRMPVPVPSFSEQEEIVRRVDILFDLADKIERRVEIATKRADKLTQAILAKAFRGELVPTEAELARKEGRSFETAEQLLERIKNEIKPPSKRVPRRRGGNARGVTRVGK